MINFDAEINSIKNDYVRGSSEIALHSLDILASAAKRMPLENQKENLIRLSISLTEAKPAMAALKNIIKKCVDAIDIFIEQKDFINALQNIKIDYLNSLNECLVLAFDKLFKDKKQLTVATCSYSGTMANLFKKASDNNIELKLFTLESKWGGYDYSSKLIFEMQFYGIEGVIWNFENNDDIINEIDFGIIGADKILKNNGIINGSPSLTLAKKLEKSKPLYVVAESVKNDDKIMTTDGYDFIPNNLITEIISDNYVI